MNEILRDRLLRKLDALPDTRRIRSGLREFLGSKYASARPGAAVPTCGGDARGHAAAVAYRQHHQGAMDAVGKAGKLLEKVAAAGKARWRRRRKRSADRDKVEETPRPVNFRHGNVGPLPLSLSTTFYRSAALERAIAEPRGRALRHPWNTLTIPLVPRRWTRSPNRRWRSRSRARAASRDPQEHAVDRQAAEVDA